MGAPGLAAAAAGLLRMLLAGAGVAGPQAAFLQPGRSGSGRSLGAAIVPASEGQRMPLMAAAGAPAVTAGEPLVLLLASLAAGRRAAARLRPRGRPGAGARQRRVPRVQRRFFNFGGPEEVVDPEDPGRVAMCGEYQNMPGQLVTAEESGFGWATVSRHSASEQDGFWPGGEAPGAVTQEWRELRLAKATESGEPPDSGTGTGQSVVKVSLCGDAEPAQVPYCMALAYAKSLCAVAMSGVHLQGALPLEAVPFQRALVVGLGGGSIPLWLEHTFPQGKMAVDALEIDPAVITVATGAMGFPKSAVRPVDGDAAAAAKDAIAGADGAALRVYAVGGEDFVEALAAQEPGDYRYDMVFLDAFDKAGQVPPVLVDPEGPFLKALPSLLAPKATIALNLLVGMTGSGSSGGPKEIEAMVSAINSTCCGEGAEVFTVRTPINESSGNQLYGFLKAGRPEGREEPLKEALRKSAEAVNEGFPADSLGKRLRFDFARRVVFSFREWQPAAAAPAGSQGGGGFGFFG